MEFMSSILRLNKVGALLLLMVVAFVISIFIGKLTIVSAQQSQSDVQSITLGISPQTLDVTANPGEVIANTFRLTNASAGTIQIKTTPKNFTPLGEEGAVNLTEDDTSYAIATWTSVSPATTTIKSNETADFEVVIDVPTDAEPGSHFGSVVFQTIPPEDDSAAAVVSQEIAPVILVKIAGEVTETAEIEEFSSTQSFWSDEATISFISRIKNTGSAHFKPTGQIVIKNMLGNEVKKLELSKENILPNSIRQITTDWTDFGFLIGNYSAELTIVSDDGNNIQTSTTSFTVFPYQTVIPVAVIVGIIGFGLFKGRKRISLAMRALSGKDADK